MNILIETEQARIAVADGVIVPPIGSFDRVIRLAGAELRAGLINAHDHLHRNHYGRLGSPLYPNAYAWARDIQARHAETIAAGRALGRRQALLKGAWKNLVSGVTHVVHHDVWEADFEQDFPLTVVRLLSADSLGHSPDFVPPAAAPFALHLAEGTDDAAAEEIRIAAARGWLNEQLLAVHAVGADEEGALLLRQSGAALVWCPTSNHFLFGRSVPEVLLGEDIDVLLGSDSLLTGAGTLLDELRAARGSISDTRLMDAVGAVAAGRLGIVGPRLTIGAPADLVLLRAPLLEAGLADIALVMAQGELRVADPQVAETLGLTGGSILEWGGVRRWISAAA